MRLTTEEFEVACDLIQADQADDVETETLVRIVIAACFVIKQRRGVPDDVEWSPPPEPELMAMVREFLADLSAVQRKRLKRIAESLELDKTRLH